MLGHPACIEQCAAVVGLAVGLAVGETLGAPVHSTFVSHACVAPPAHWSPPCAGAGFVHVRACSPVPHVPTHDPKALQPPCVGHACSVSHGSSAAPAHAAPPWAGAGASHSRDRVPVPHAPTHAP